MFLIVFDSCRPHTCRVAFKFSSGEGLLCDLEKFGIGSVPKVLIQNMLGKSLNCDVDTTVVAFIADTNNFGFRKKGCNYARRAYFGLRDFERNFQWVLNDLKDIVLDYLYVNKVKKCVQVQLTLVKTLIRILQKKMKKSVGVVRHLRN